MRASGLSNNQDCNSSHHKNWTGSSNSSVYSVHAEPIGGLGFLGSWRARARPRPAPRAGCPPTNRLDANSSSDILFIFERLEISFIVKPLAFSILPQNHSLENSVGLPIKLVGDLGGTFNPPFVTGDLKGCLSSSP